MHGIGIRREDKNEWERRVPLTPDHVAELVEQHGVSVRVQPSSIRAFPDKDYRSAGAEVQESLAASQVILGVKEIPDELLLPGARYLFFSHTSKGQPYNMPMLRRILELGSTLLDYEHVLDERGRRLIFFGRYAGHAGMIDALWALGRRLAAEGIPTPFERVRLAHDYSSLDEATSHIARIGESLRHTGVPAALHPLIVGFTGSGNVSRGALEIFDRLPHVEVDAEDLPEIAGDPEHPRNVVYRTTFRREQRFVGTDGAEPSPTDLARHPERLQSGLSRWLPHLTILVHGAFWAPPQPRLVRIADLRELWRGAAPRLRVLADISCDIGGGLEPTVRATTPGDPVYVYDLDRNEAVSGVEGRGPVVLAVDNLPCQLPVESSQHFGDTLLRFVPALARCRWDAPLDALDLPRELSAAIVAHQGRLTPRFAYLEEPLGRAGKAP